MFRGWLVANWNHQTKCWAILEAIAAFFALDGGHNHRRLVGIMSSSMPCTQWEPLPNMAIPVERNVHSTSWDFQTGAAQHRSQCSPHCPRFHAATHKQYEQGVDQIAQEWKENARKQMTSFIGQTKMTHLRPNATSPNLVDHFSFEPALTIRCCCRTSIATWLEEIHTNGRRGGSVSTEVEIMRCQDHSPCISTNHDGSEEQRCTSNKFWKTVSYPFWQNRGEIQRLMIQHKWLSESFLQRGWGLVVAITGWDSVRIAACSLLLLLTSDHFWSLVITFDHSWLLITHDHWWSLLINCQNL
jgi:hypothetical protein